MPPCLGNGCHIDRNDIKVYIKDCRLHREDGPARIWPNGREEWYVHGMRHREGGPAYIETEECYKSWYHYGKRHRIDGPAIMDVDNRFEWWLCGKRYSKVDEYLKELAKGDEEHATLMKLEWG